MSLCVVYHDRAKAVIASDDRATSQDLATLETSVVDGRVSKIVVLPRTLVFGTVGRLDVGQKLFRGTARMCRERDLGFDDLAEALPPILQRVWSARTPLPEGLGASVNQQDSLLLGIDGAGKIRCRVFLSEKNFEPVETTALRGNRTAIIGAFDVGDEELLREFTKDVGLKGEAKRAPWIAAKMRTLIDAVSALHPEAIGAASYFCALNRDGFVALPAEFPPPPDLPSPARALAGTRATAGRFYLGSVTTPVAGGTDTTGHNDGGVGAQGGEILRLAMSPSASGNFQFTGNGAKVNDYIQAIDGDTTTFCGIKITGAAGVNEADLCLGGVPGIGSSYSSAVLHVLAAVPTSGIAGGSSTYQISYGVNGFASPGVLNNPATSLLLGSGTPAPTAAKQVYTATLPINLNLSLVSLRFVVTTGGATSGVLEMDVYEAWIEVET